VGSEGEDEVEVEGEEEVEAEVEVEEEEEEKEEGPYSMADIDIDLIMKWRVACRKSRVCNGPCNVTLSKPTSARVNNMPGKPPTADGVNLVRKMLRTLPSRTRCSEQIRWVPSPALIRYLLLAKKIKRDGLVSPCVPSIWR